MNVSGAESQLSSSNPKDERGGQRRFVTWFLASTPWITILIMGTMIAHVLIVFGHEVQITHMTEFSRSLRIHESIFGLSLLIAIVSFPIWILTACSRRFRLKT